MNTITKTFTRNGLGLKIDRCNYIFRMFSLHKLMPEHKQLQETCRAYAEANLKPIAGDLDRNEIFPTEQIKQMGEMGLMAINVHPDYDGSGLDILALSIVVEEIARGCGGTGSIVSIHNCLYGSLLNRLANKEQKEQFLKPFTKGVIGAFALSESDAGSDVAAMSTTAKKDGDHWILNGTKAWVTSACEAKAAVIFATVDKQKLHKGITAFLVPIPTKGLTLGRKEKKLGIKATSTCSIILEDVRVSQYNVLGEIGGGFRIAMEQLDLARIGIASQALGIARAALDTAVQYASIRKAFGNAIINMPTVKSHIADMALRLEAARLLVHKAACIKDAGERSTKYSSMAKVSASQCATFVSHEAMQILGGVGYCNDMPAERHYRDARITEIYGGITDVQKMVIADQVIREYDL